LISKSTLFLKLSTDRKPMALLAQRAILTCAVWLLEPPDHKPTREEFGLPQTSLISADIRGVIKSMEEKQMPLESVISAEVMVAYQNERRYHGAMQEWQQYQNWLKTRNPARAELERKHKYDTKHAMHLVRLMLMGEELLEQGLVLVERPDREMLIAVREGKWQYEYLIEWAETQDAKLNELYQKCTVLPKAPNVNKLDALCNEIVADYH
jgi:uncharacterized protein